MPANFLTKASLVFATILMSAHPAAAGAALRSAPASQALFPDKTYRIISVNSGLAVDVYGLSREPGAAVQQWSYWNSPNQQWRFVAAANNAYQIVSVNSGLCLDVVNISTQGGAAVQQWDCWNTPGQLWYVAPVDNGAYELKNMNSGQALDVVGQSQQGGARLQQWPYWGSANQKWLLQPVDNNGNPTGGVAPEATYPSAQPGLSTGILGDGADPSIAFWRGRYYLVMGDFARHVWVFSSNNLQNILHDQRDVWEWNDDNFHAEAPDIAVVTDPRDGREKLAIYVSCDAPVPGTIRVLLTEDPKAGISDMGGLAGITGYDAHYIKHPNGNQYLSYSTFASIQLIAMQSPWATLGGPVAISTAQMPWELQNGTVLNEAPAHVIGKNTLNLIYSANAWHQPEYLSGRLTIPLDADPMNPSLWTKDKAGPIFEQNNGILGPGSGSFFNDGVNTWWSYGALTDPFSRRRVLRAQVVDFDDNGVVHLGVPH